jgi:hypothetical protein
MTPPKTSPGMSPIHVLRPDCRNDFEGWMCFDISGPPSGRVTPGGRTMKFCVQTSERPPRLTNGIYILPFTLNTPSTHPTSTHPQQAHPPPYHRHTPHERKQGFSTEQVPVSAYGGSLKNLKDLKGTEVCRSHHAPRHGTVQGYLAHEKTPTVLGPP